MNDYYVSPRRRGQTLLIVEGDHEGNELFPLLLRCFPELGIRKENIWVYKTNIYVLYDCIEKAYGSEWQKEDVDLPYVISRKEEKETRYKEDFTNIILVFDYERQHTYFSEEKIESLQRYFHDETDVGKLYLNYPMVEAYQDLHSIPDDSFADRKVPASIAAGGEYKDPVHRSSCVEAFVDFFHGLDIMLKDKCGIEDSSVRNRCYERLLLLDRKDDIQDAVIEILKGAVPENKMQTAKNFIRAKVVELQYTQAGKTYWMFMRDVFKEIIRHNICKANRIQNGNYLVDPDKYRECFEGIDLQELLGKQNDASRDKAHGFIWVLATCVFVIPEYNFKLLD